MKFWQLVSMAQGSLDLIFRIAASREEWNRYMAPARNFSDLVKVQDRAVLNSIIDPAFSKAVLENISQKLYLSSDNWLRSWQSDPADQEISISVAVDRYGADITETVLERGAMEVF